MIVGVTGTRKGLTAAQVAAAHRLLDGVTVLHHGDCQGADVTLAQMAEQYGMHTVSHPPDNGRWRAYLAADVTWKPKAYLARNRDIVDCSARLLAFPDGPEQQMGSGTWATVRYAVRVRVPVVVVAPDGSMERR